MAEAAVDLHLKGFVVAAGVVAEVRQVNRAASERRAQRGRVARVSERWHAVLEERTAIGLRHERNESARCAGGRCRTRNEVGATAGGRCVDVVGRAVGVERMRALVADVRDFDRHVRSDLALDGSVPRVESRQTLNRGTDSGARCAVGTE